MFLFSLFLLCSILPASAAGIRVLFNGEPLSFDASPVIENDRVMVPMRGILKALGYTVEWQESTQTVFAVNDSVSIQLPLESNVAVVNGKNVALDAPAHIRQERTYVPLRFLARYSGANILWDGKTNTVSISFRQDSSEEKLKASVVYIQTNKMQGSGVILSKEGLIATNFHVIQNASTLQMIFQDGTVYQGNTTVVGLSPQEDIALLKIEKTDLTPAAISTEIREGEGVYAIGSPQGQRNLLTEGIIEGYDRDVICTTAPIEHGSSGGGLFNASGKLIGITSFFGEGQYFSIPISSVMQVSQTLSIPISEMKHYIYTPSAPKNLRYRLDEDGYAYVSWSPVYDADYYIISMSYYANGPFTRLQNKAVGRDIWYWGFPQGFGIGINKDHPFYLKISAVVDGKATEESQVLKIEP